MESQKNLSRLFKIFFPFTDFLYILQQEEYSLQRVWFWLPRFFLRRNFQNRDTLIYTQRIRVTLILSVLIFFIVLFIGFIFNEVHAFLIAALTCVCIPIIVIISNSLLNPFYNVIKKQIVKKASTYFKENRGDGKVVAITGSYGKTTVKNFIEQFVKYSYKTQIVPGNINSTIGISNWILNNFKKGTEVLIVEMDSYVLGRIAKSTKLVDPDISIITNIGDQHLQRYKTKENLAISLFELFKNSKKESIKITDDETLEYLNNKGFDTKDIETLSGSTESSNLSESNNKNLEYALRVAKILMVPQKYIDHTSNNLTLPERRQAYKEMFGFEGIDDSYNISYVTACAGINEALNKSKSVNKKLLVITAGIPELGPLEQDKNKKLSELLNTKSEKVFVLKSIYYPDIVSGIDKNKVYVFKNFTEAIADLQKNYNKNEWFILVQPELTDIYY